MSERVAFPWSIPLTNRMVLWTVLVACAAGAQASNAEEKARVKARLVADTNALAAGKTFRLGVAFTIDDDWHIYWKHPGQTGQATQVTWKLPDGFKAGPLQYPTPRKFVDKAGIVSYGYENEVLIFAEITPPKDLPAGKKLTLKAGTEWLACKTLCVLGSAELSAELPVAADGASTKPAHEDLFTSAEQAMPVPADKAEHLTITSGTNVDRVRPGDEFKLGVRLDIAKGMHIQSHKPLDEAFVATDLFIGAPDTVVLELPKFPEGKVREVSGMKLSEYAGTVRIMIPARATADLEPGKLTAEAVLVYQVCKDSGVCLPPMSARIEIPIHAAEKGAEVTKANASIFAGQSTDAAKDEQDRQAAATEAAATDAQATDRQAAPAKQQEAAGTGAGSEDLTAAADPGIVLMLVFAFLGGLILNVMPCVLPVISIKIMSFVEQAGEDAKRIFLLGMSFAAGMVAFFLLLGLLAMAVRIGPGWVLQNTLGVVIITTVIFAFALSLFGVFEIQLPGKASSNLASAASKEGPGGAFAKGFFATILGTSCTAPFISTAWSAALAASPPVRLILFLVMGLGMASPYILLSAKPDWMKLLPKPGPWMDGFKQFMGFVLIATALWLLWVLEGHVGPDGLIWMLVFLTVVSLALWMIGRIPATAGKGRWARTTSVAVAILIAGSLGFRYQLDNLPEQEGTTAQVSQAALLGNGDGEGLDYTTIPWQPYEKGLAEKLADEGKVVFVDFTARWCATCQTNKQVVLETDEIRSAMKRLGVIPLKADYTRKDPQLAKELERFDRPGVPLNIVYGPSRPDDPIVLPELLSKDRVLDALNQAAGG